eukprot:UN01427
MVILRKSHVQQQSSFTRGLQKILKFVVPPAKKVVFRLDEDDTNVITQVRTGRQCPGRRTEDKFCGDTVELKNSEFDDDKIFWVTVTTSSTKNSDGFQIEQIMMEEYYPADFSDTNTCGSSFTATNRAHGCIYYGAGDNYLFCGYDKDINGIFAAQACQQCGCDEILNKNHEEKQSQNHKDISSKDNIIRLFLT